MANAYYGMNMYNYTGTTTTASTTAMYDVYRAAQVVPWKAQTVVEKKQDPKTFYQKLTVETNEWLKDVLKC